MTDDILVARDLSESSLTVSDAVLTDDAELVTDAPDADRDRTLAEFADR